MATVLAHFMRRTAGTCFVLLALFVACASVQASPCDAPLEHAIHAGLALEDTTSGDDLDATPSLEDNSAGLDDTFDVPPAHTLIIARGLAMRPPAMAPPPHAHHHSFELRPPIA